ncbi:MAG: helix-turn-helix domain-containing protein [Butyricicoccus pullicaecorum]|nr:helix-turn-helix domain-containing protein [Butyricicoccus pullicaecorum]
MFYDRFIQLCKAGNMTPAKVADKLGINKSTVYMWKNQGTSPRFDTGKKIADFFEVDINWLMHGNTLEQREQEMIDKVQKRFINVKKCVVKDMSDQERIFYFYTQRLNTDGKLAAGEFFRRHLDQHFFKEVADYMERLARIPQYQIADSDL